MHATVQQRTSKLHIQNASVIDPLRLLSAKLITKVGLLWGQTDLQQFTMYSSKFEAFTRRPWLNFSLHYTPLYASAQDTVRGIQKFRSWFWLLKLSIFIVFLIYRSLLPAKMGRAAPMRVFFVVTSRTTAELSPERGTGHLQEDDWSDIERSNTTNFVQLSW
jgi:hypothetical protein